MRIGIDLGGTKIEGVSMAPDGTVTRRQRVATPVALGYRGILGAIETLVGELEQGADQPGTVGIGTPGSLSPRTGLLRNSNTTCLNGRPIAGDLESLLGRPVRIENDANCFALSEAADGAAAGARVVFGIIMGTGVGGGIVVDGRLIRGRHLVAGEWGHNALDDRGPACYCGRFGCVETLLSGPGLAANYGYPADHAQDLLAAARRGNRDARDAVDRFIDNFGRAVAQVVNILDPDVIVLGGGLSNAPELHTEGPAAVARHVFSDLFDTPILRNRHGDSSGVLGAARLWPAAPETAGH